MALFGINNSLDREYYLPVPPQQAFDALLGVAQDSFTVRSSDTFTKSLDFSTGISAFTYGERVSGQVVPAADGCTLRLSIVPKVGGGMLQGRRNQELLERVFNKVVERVRPA